MVKVGVSACLVGKNTKYNRGNNYNNKVMDYLKDKEVFLIRPEIAGGLSIPRLSSEIVNDTVMNTNGEDVTSYFVAGANKMMAYLKENGVSIVILKENSPSCGYRHIYDGTFSGKLINGSGIFARLAIKEGFKIMSEKDFE